MTSRLETQITGMDDPSRPLKDAATDVSSRLDIPYATAHIYLLAHRRGISHTQYLKLPRTNGHHGDRNGYSLTNLPAKNDGFAEVDNRDFVEALLKVLTPTQRLIIEMFYLEGHTLPEIAEVLGDTNGKSPNTTKGRALAKMRKRARELLS